MKKLVEIIKDYFEQKNLSCGVNVEGVFPNPEEFHITIKTKISGSLSFGHREILKEEPVDLSKAAKMIILNYEYALEKTKLKYGLA